MSIRFTLLADGTSDRLLMPIIRWTFRQHFPENAPLDGAFAEMARLAKRAIPHNLSGRISLALDLHPCDILLVHRDAEKQDPNERHREIRQAFEDASAAHLCLHVGVVPIRMTEACLLFDEPAIRRAAGNPNGKTALNLPAIQQCEQLPDPKATLREVLRLASGLTGRRLRSFRTHQALARVADLIDDFTPLRRLRAFARFEADVRRVVAHMAP